MRPGPTLNVARWVARSRVNGPGERFVLWVQGCAIRCAGCWNRDTWSHVPRVRMTVDEVLREVDAASGIDGVTLTGGEPFEQAEALLPLAEALRARGLSVMAFTGREPAELSGPAERALIACLDVLVVGRYEAAQRSLDLGWRGSRNQQIRFLTTRHDERDLPAGREAEVHLSPDGAIVVMGFPEAGLLSV